MPERPLQKPAPYVILAAAIAAVAALAIGLFFILRPTSSPEPSETPEVPTALETEESTDTPPASSESPEPTPEAQPEESTTSDELLEGTEASEEVPNEASTAPRVPRPSDDELTGPLPVQEEGEQVASLPTLHEPIPFNVPPPPRVDPLPSASQQQRPTQQAATTTGAPDRVLLRRAVQFPVTINGRPSGNVSVPPRTPVTVRRVLPNGRLEIGYHHSIAIVPVAFTDYHQRVRPSAPAARPGQQRINTFPDQTLNPAMRSGAPSAAPRREIPIQ